MEKHKHDEMPDPEKIKEILEKKFQVDVNIGPSLTLLECIEAVKEYDGILSMLADSFSQEA